MVKSPYPPVEIPDVGLSEHVLAAVRGREDKVALIDGLSGVCLTYGEIHRSVQEGAQALIERGVRRGDVVAVLIGSGPEAVIAFHSAGLAGATVTPINPLYTAEEKAAQFLDAGARWVITSADSAEQAGAAATAAGAEVLTLPLVPADAAQRHELPRLDPAEDLALLPYSSGTTGLPKGVMLTHRTMVANLVQVGSVLPFRDDDIVIAALPFFHLTGLQLLFNLSMGNGATVITLPRFDLGRFLSLIERHRVTRAFIVPPIALMLAKDPIVDDYDLSSLRVLFCGAAPVGAELQVACESRLGCAILQGYGLTESGPVVTQLIEDDGTDASGSAGRAMPNTELRIVDLESGSDVAPGDRGEIWIRGPQVMRGYLNRPAETAAALPGDGWLRSGDIGYLDEHERLHIVDRVKEMIKYKGFQVAPAELEAVLISHPGVADVAVIPRPDPEAGEIPKALVVTRDEVTAEELQAFVAARVAPYKKVRQVQFVDSIPKSASGKILRRELIERERAGSPS